MSSDGIGSTLSISLFFGVIGVIVFIFMRRAFQSFYVPKCYDPRLEEEFIPNPKDCTGYLDWLSYTYHYPEEKIFRQYGGFDAIIYLRWLKYCFYYFLGNTIFACVFLIPVYATAENHKKKTSDTGYVDGIDIISLANVEQGSKRLWATLVSIFIITGITLYFVWKNYKICIDFNILEAHKSRSQSRTVMVAELPSSVKTDQDLLDMFSKIYRKQVVLAHIVPRCTKLRKLQKERSELYKKWKIYNELYEINPMQRPTMDTFAVKIPLIGQELDLGLIPKIGKQVDALKFYEEAIFLLDKKIAYKQARITKLTKVAFVTFANVPTAMSCSQTQHHKNRDKMIIKRAPDPEIINWGNLGVSRKEQYSRLLVSAGMMVGLFLFWTIPVSFLSAFSNLETLSKVDGLSFLVVLVSQNSYVQGFVEDFLPTFFLSLFMSLLPDILRFILSQTKYHLKTEEENGVLKSYWTFLLLNVFLVSTIAGSITSILDEVIGDYTKIPVLLSNSLPGQAVFFINYIIADGYRNYPFVLGRYIDFGIAKVKQRFWCETPSEKQDAEDPGSFEYSESLPSEMLVFMIGLVYSSMQPLILPFATIYFAMAYFTSKYNFIFLYKAEYEGQRVTGSIVNFTIVSLLIYHATFIGLFALKLFPYAAFVLVPMIVTLLCTFYFQRVYKTATKFVPLCDCPIDKATVSELIEVIAMYTDPAMKPPPKYKGEEDIIITDQDQFVDDDDVLKLPKETLRMAFGAVKSVASKVQRGATTVVSTATNTVNTAVNTAANTVVSLPSSTASQLKQLARFAKSSSQTQEEDEDKPQGNQDTEQNNSNNNAQV